MSRVRMEQAPRYEECTGHAPYISRTFAVHGTGNPPEHARFDTERTRYGPDPGTEQTP